MAIFEIIVESVSELWRPRAIIRESVTHMDWRNMSILENNVETTLMYPNLEKRRFSAIAARLSWRVVESDFVMLVIQLNASKCSLARSSVLANHGDSLRHCGVSFQDRPQWRAR